MQRTVKCILLLVLAALVCHLLLLLPLLHGRDSAYGRAAHVDARENFLHSFDANGDGVLDSPEFDLFIQEVCALDALRLTPWQRAVRYVSLHYWWRSPCSRAMWRGAADSISVHSSQMLHNAWQHGGSGALAGRGGAFGLWPSQPVSQLSEQQRQQLHQQQEQRQSDADADMRQQQKQQQEAEEDEEGAGLVTSTEEALAAGNGQDADDEDEAAADGVGRGDPRAGALRRVLAGCEPLSRELLATVAGPSRTVVMATADWNMFDVMGVNWLAQVQAAGMSNYLIAAMDARTADFLVSNKLGHCFRWYADGKDGATPPGGYRPGSAHFLEARWRRVEALMRITAYGFDAVASDLDTIWHLDPVPYLRHHAAAADIVVASDGLSTEAAPGDAGLEPGALSIYHAGLPAFTTQQRGPGSRRRPLPVHTGAVFVRATPGGRAALDGWAAARSTGDSDAEAFLKWASAGGGPVAAGGHYARRLVVVDGAGRAPSMVGLFSPAVVLNGYTYFVSQLHLAQQLPPGPIGGPLAVHMGHMPGGKEAKVHRMREATRYADGPRYYSDFQLLSFNFTPPAPPLGFESWVDEGAMLAWHVTALSEQLLQLYWAMELAVLLDRALIMPPLQCYCYNSLGYEGVQRCRAVGDTSPPTPFNCTLDQVFDPGVLYQHARVFDGKRLLFKEASYLHNPRLPGWIRSTRTEVLPGRPACGDCVDIATMPPPGVNQRLTVPVGLTDSALERLLQPFGAAKWLHLGDPAGLRLSFASAARQSAFEGWLQRARVPWCCRGGSAVAGSEGAGAEGGAAGFGADGAPVPVPMLPRVAMG